MYDIGQWMNYICSSTPINHIEETLIVCWHICRARNDVVWNKKKITAVEVVRSARMVLSRWKKTQVHKHTSLLSVNDFMEAPEL